QGVCVRGGKHTHLLEDGCDLFPERASAAMNPGRRADRPPRRLRLTAIGPIWPRGALQRLERRRLRRPTLRHSGSTFDSRILTPRTLIRAVVWAPHRLGFSTPLPQPLDCTAGPWP